MAWRVAGTLEVLRAEFNAVYPKRDEASDGSIGDAAHASRDSDHNPWVKDGGEGIVTARDFDEDLTASGGGKLMEGVCQRIVAGARAGRLPQVKYVIYERRIFSSTRGFVAKAYAGKNAHCHHMHVSVQPSKSMYDRTAPWNVVATAPPRDFELGERLIRVGDTGKDVAEVQRILRLTVDGIFGPLTALAVERFQAAHGLAADGDVGPLTARALIASKPPPKTSEGLTVGQYEELKASIAGLAEREDARNVQENARNAQERERFQLQERQYQELVDIREALAEVRADVDALRAALPNPPAASA